MVMGWRWPVLLLWCFLATSIDRVHAQSQGPEGFISIDCGIPADNSYTDSITRIPYTSDSGFINTGDNYNVASPTRQEATLRSFANGLRRNCYTIKPVQNDLKYLVRATFMYGNYDGKETTNIVFELHIGVNFWTAVNVTDASFVYSKEALITSTGTLIRVCLVDIESGTPFISSLEIRPLEKTIYNAVNPTNALGLLARVDMGSAGKAVRYPDDIYDRIWDPNSHSVIEYPNIPDEWQAISTTSPIKYDDSDTFQVPSTVMQTAVIRQLKNDDGLNFRWYHDNWLNFSWHGDKDRDGADYKYYINIHFTNIDKDALTLVRELNVYINDKLWLNNERPRYMRPDYQHTGPIDIRDEYNVSIRGSSSHDSKLPPIMNALEVYYVINLSELATDDNDGNPSLCANMSSCGQNHCPKWSFCGWRIYLCVSIVSVVLVVVLVLCVWGPGRRKSKSFIQGLVWGLRSRKSEPSIGRECRVYTYNELEKITENFSRLLGSGGFGTVYHGKLENDTQVAVKKSSKNSEQATRGFVAEVQILTRAHHTSLVNLVGYCTDGGNLALVYEYIAKGSLQEHLSGVGANARSLNWIERLQIALGAAEGLNYLHVGCEPPIVHRDVKTSNILLNEKFEAKVADFGLSKAFRSSTQTHETMETVGGTPVYVDPEYNKTRKLTRKSDVYSFGVVLFELITGLPSWRDNAEVESLVDWVEIKLKSGGVAEIVDSSLQGYCINSVSKVVELAKKCTENTHNNRPSMSHVVVDLNESLELAARESFQVECPRAPLLKAE